MWSYLLLLRRVGYCARYLATQNTPPHSNTFSLLQTLYISAVSASKSIYLVSFCSYFAEIISARVTLLSVLFVQYLIIMAATHVLRMKHLFYSIPNSALKTLRSTRGAIGCEQGNGSTRFKTGRGKIVPNNIGSTSTERHKKFHIPTVGGLDHSILTTNNTSGLGDGNVVQSFTLPDGRVAINRNPRNRQLDGTIHRTKGFQTNATVPNFFHRYSELTLILGLFVVWS